MARAIVIALAAAVVGAAAYTSLRGSEHPGHGVGAGSRPIAVIDLKTLEVDVGEIHHVE